MTILDVIEKLFFPVIITMIGLMTTYARQVVGQITDLTSSVKLIQQELNIKMGHQEERIKDHEDRLRGIEIKRRGVLHGKRVNGTSESIERRARHDRKDR